MGCIVEKNFLYAKTKPAKATRFASGADPRREGVVLGNN